MPNTFIQSCVQHTKHDTTVKISIKIIQQNQDWQVGHYSQKVQKYWTNLCDSYLQLWTQWMIYFLKLIKERENLITITGRALSSTSQEQSCQGLLEAALYYPLDLLWLPAPHQLIPLPLCKENPPKRDEMKKTKINQPTKTRKKYLLDTLFSAK